MSTIEDRIAIGPGACRRHAHIHNRGFDCHHWSVRETKVEKRTIEYLACSLCSEVAGLGELV